MTQWGQLLKTLHLVDTLVPGPPGGDQYVLAPFQRSCHLLTQFIYLYKHTSIAPPICPVLGLAKMETKLTLTMDLQRPHQKKKKSVKKKRKRKSTVFQFQKATTEWPQHYNLSAIHLHSSAAITPEKLNFLQQNDLFFFSFLDCLLVNCQTNWGFPEEWHSTWKWEFGALVHYVALTRLQSSSAGVSLGPLRVLNNASYSLSRELISSKLSNQHLEGLEGFKREPSTVWLGVIQKEIFDLSMENSFFFNIQTGPQQQRWHDWRGFKKHPTFIRHKRLITCDSNFLRIFLILFIYLQIL